jgi:hypothetical protein
MTAAVVQGAATVSPEALRQDSLKTRIIQQYRDSLRQDSLQRAIAAPADTASSAMPMPEMRTPQNTGYLIAAFVVAGSIYTLYLLIMFRRWSALRRRQQRNASRADR